MARANGKDTHGDIDEQLATLRSDVAVLTTMIGEMASQKADAVQHDAKDTADALKTRLKDKADDIEAKAHHYGEEAQQVAADAFGYAQTAMQRQPCLIIGAAAGVGFLLGMMMTRRG